MISGSPRTVVRVPVAPAQLMGASSAMVRARSHRAFATSTSASKQPASCIVRNSHRISSLFWKMNSFENTFLNASLNALLNAFSFRDSFPRRCCTIYFMCNGVRCGRPESNRQGETPHKHPRPARLPVSPRPPNAWGQPCGHPQGLCPGHRVRGLWRHGGLLSGVSAPAEVSGTPSSPETAVGVSSLLFNPPLLRFSPRQGRCRSQWTRLAVRTWPHLSAQTCRLFGRGLSTRRWRSFCRRGPYRETTWSARHPGLVGCAADGPCLSAPPPQPPHTSGLRILPSRLREGWSVACLVQPMLPRLQPPFSASLARLLRRSIAFEEMTACLLASCLA